MRIIEIPDLHGSNIWEDILPFVDQYDKIIFLGDYMDSYDYSDQEIADNFLKILDFKRSNPEKVILILGNHDLQYLFDTLEGLPVYCSGKRPSMVVTMKEHFEKAYNDGLFKLAYEAGPYLFSHAGITLGWWEEVNEKLFQTNHRLKQLWEGESVVNKINILLDIKSKWMNTNSIERGGSSKNAGPLWVDKSVMLKTPLSGFIHVVGHTKVDKIEKWKANNFVDVIFTDVIDNFTKSKPKFLTLKV
jgi:hypothetical protein